MNMKKNTLENNGKTPTRYWYGYNINPEKAGGTIARFCSPAAIKEAKKFGWFPIAKATFDDMDRLCICYVYENVLTVQDFT